MDVEFKIRHIINNGAPEDEVRNFLTLLGNNSIKELYVEIKTYDVFYENTVRLELVGTRDRYFCDAPDFLISGMLSEGADAIENNDKLQFLTNAYSGFGEKDVMHALDLNPNKFKVAQVMYIWTFAISR